ncbi:MAG: tetratricopeptide repeat protein [Planctomycetes bacterium]|nr:tetratricopeptide repeat protein [Planctomycetota bacterium]
MHSAQIHIQRAQLLIDQNRYAMAEEELAAAIGLEPNLARAHSLMSVCLSERGRHDDALAAATHAIGLEPDNPNGHYFHAFALMSADKYTPAIEAVDRAIAMFPYSEHYFGLKANLLLAKNQWAEALAAANQGLQIDAEDVTCANVRATALTKLGRRDEAGQTIRDTLHRNPENAQTHANQGWTLLHEGDAKQALVHFQEALRLDPEHEWARAGIVEALKARNPIYRWLLRYTLWSASLSQRTQWGMMVGLVVGIILLNQNLSDLSPALDTLVFSLMLAYAAFAMFTWIGSPLFDLLLLLDRYGRHALGVEQKRDAYLFGAGVVIVIALIATAMTIGTLSVMIPFPLLLVPLSGAVRGRHPLMRRVGGGVFLVLAACGAASLWFYHDAVTHFAQLPLTNDPAVLREAIEKAVRDPRFQQSASIGRTLRTVTLWGCVLSSWIRNAIATYIMQRR